MKKEHPGFAESRLCSTMTSAYDGRHHLIRYSTGQVEFFDVSTDPGEEKDLAPAGGEDFKRLRRLLEKP
jgi:hypothetical protein